MLKKLAICLTGLLVIPLGLQAQEQEKNKANSAKKADPLEKINKAIGKLRKLPEGEVWIDLKNRQVVIDGEICLRRGPLEMLACPPHTKEHESIIQAHAKSFIVHTALLMVGAKSGKPVEWQPEYKPASGNKIEITVYWLDKEGKIKKCRAQEWIKNVKTQKAMTEDWVFAGSEFYTNPNTKVRHYLADGGEMICVSNFTTAMMDLPIESTQSREGLIFEAFTDKIPPMKTPVRIVLKPVLKKKKDQKPSNPADSNSGDPAKEQSEKDGARKVKKPEIG